MRDLTPYTTGVTVPKLNQARLRSIAIPCRRSKCSRRSWPRSRATRKSSTAPAPSSTTTAPTSPSTPTGRWSRLGEVCRFKRGPFGGSLKKEIFVRHGYAVFEQGHAISGDFDSFSYFIDEVKYSEMHAFQVHPNDVIMSCSGTMGRTAVVPDHAPSGIINQALLKLTVTDGLLTPFLKLWMDSSNFQQSIANVAFGAAIKNVASVKVLKSLQIPLPTRSTQQSIIEEIQSEQALVDANQDLIARFERRIQAAIARVWRDDASRTAA